MTTYTVTRIDSDMITARIGDYRTSNQAMHAAKSAAGCGASYVRRGCSYGYDGPAGLALVAKTDGAGNMDQNVR
jgi:predicted ABC-type ATPase